MVKVLISNVTPLPNFKTLISLSLFRYFITQETRMNKRKSENQGDDTNKKQTKHWSLGLLESMNDPNLIVKESHKIVVIKDKYPKAKIHYLAIPRDNINSIFKLNSSQCDILDEFQSLYEYFKDKHKGVQLRAGFHAIPSMQRLHMHIISLDMISPSLRTKIHWNSFTTEFFIPLKDIIAQLKENGSIDKISQEQHKKLMSSPLICNQCSFQPKNMPQLKEHLLTHDK